MTAPHLVGIYGSTAIHLAYPGTPQTLCCRHHTDRPAPQGVRAKLCARCQRAEAAGVVPRGGRAANPYRPLRGVA